jgi:hypothetical protein
MECFLLNKSMRNRVFLYHSDNMLVIHRVEFLFVEQEEVDLTRIELEDFFNEVVISHFISCVSS